MLSLYGRISIQKRCYCHEKESLYDKAFNEIIRGIAIRYRNSPKHIIQVFQHIETVGLGSLNQAVCIRRGNSAIIRLAEEPILSANYKRADRVFGGGFSPSMDEIRGFFVCAAPMFQV